MLNSDYILGLIDGEGSFTVYVRNPDDKSRVKRRVKMEPRFYLKLVMMREKKRLTADGLKAMYRIKQKMH